MPSVTRRSQSTRAQRREQVSRRMLAAVERLLEEESFTELSIERLVKEAELSRSTFYVYFEDKGDLLRALTEDVIEDVMVAVRGWLALPADAGFDAIRAAMANILAAYEPHRLLMAAVVESSSYDPRMREDFGSRLQGVMEEMTAEFAAGQKRGDVRPDIDAAAVAGWLGWMTERGLYHVVGRVTPAQRERHVDALTKIIWNTLYRGVR